MTEMNGVVGTAEAVKDVAEAGIAAIEAAPIVNENTMKWIIVGGVTILVGASGYFLYKKAKKEEWFKKKTAEEPKELEGTTEDKDEETK